MKTSLITLRNKLNAKNLADIYRKLSYKKYFVFTQECEVSEQDLRKNKNVTVINCNRGQIPQEINRIFEDNKKDLILPYFRGVDADSKYAIKVYNKSFGLKINSSNFRIKSKMNSFLGNEIVRKKSFKFSHDEIIALSYQELSKKVGESFILKPTNAAASLLNFKISTEEGFQNAKKKLKKKYKYLIEEYLTGNLYSIDFFCNGQDIFLLCFVREIPFLEMLEKLSSKYLEKYHLPITTDFLHFFPISYSLDLSKISNLELDFIKTVGRKLIESNYHGFIHLEYKVNKKEKKIGFIEWGARMGGKRDYFLQKMHNVRAENIPLKILAKEDLSQFKKKKGIYFLRNRDIDKNMIFIKTNVIKKTHIMRILEKIPNFLNISFERFLKEYFWDNWKIRIDEINFNLSTSPEGYLHPFYDRSDAKLTYTLRMKEESFIKFLKKKFSILEKLVFHDY